METVITNLFACIVYCNGIQYRASLLADACLHFMGEGSKRSAN